MTRSHRCRSAVALLMATVLLGVGSGAGTVRMAPDAAGRAASAAVAPRAAGIPVGTTAGTAEMSTSPTGYIGGGVTGNPMGGPDGTTGEPRGDASGTTGEPRGSASGTAGTANVVSRSLPKADAVRRDQWQLTELRAQTAWRYSAGDGVVVGVLDSGVDAKHPDLAGQVLPGLDLVTSSQDGRVDPVGHGTTVAGLIAGSGSDQRGALGLAPKAKILPVRVLDKDNRYEDAVVVAQGVRWAVDHGAKVLNLSLGGVGDSAALAEALDYAFAKDVVVIACTGNVTASAPTEVWYPAREPGVVAVSGLDKTRGGTRDDILWANSITGSATVLSAPATALVGARPGGYWRVQGTSFAAPLVTATAALIRSRWPSMSAGNVVNRLIRTARDLGPKGRDASYGFGAVDPVAALTRSIPEIAANPLDTAPPPGLAGFGPAPGTVDIAVGGATDAEKAGNLSGAGAEATARGSSAESHGGLLGGLAVFLILVVGGVLVFRRLDRPPW